MNKKQVLVVYLGLFLLANFIVFNFVNSSSTPNPKLVINNNQATTKVRKVNLTLIGPPNVRQMKIANDISFADTSWETFQSTKTWYLKYGNGTHTVYVQFKDYKGTISLIYKDTIQLSVPSSMSADFVINKDAENKNGREQTTSRYVVLHLNWSEGVEQFAVSNSSDFANSDWLQISETHHWVLSPDSGDKTVFMQFKDANEKTSTVQRKIKYNQPANYVDEGTLLKGQGSSVYYLGFDGQLHPFLNSAIFHSWYSDFSNLKYVSNLKLSEYKIGNPVCVRAGTWLLKFRGLPSVYAVETGCQLKLIRSEGEARLLYGPNWSQRVIELDSVLQSFYTVNYPKVETGKIDRDRDGVSKDIEDFYGTSDLNRDSDSDGLSDYEEIYFWFSDPVNPDTDGDGFSDGLEASLGYSPVGPAVIAKVDEGTYTYPAGTVILVEGTYYYIDENNVYNFITKKESDNKFTSNLFRKEFVINQMVKIPFTYSSKNKIKSAEEKIIRPQIKNNLGKLINL